MTRLAMMTLGYSFLALGVLGLFLPFLQGFLFLAIGLMILASHAPWAKRLLERLKGTHPRMARAIESTEGRVEQIRLSTQAKLRSWRQGFKRVWR